MPRLPQKTLFARSSTMKVGIPLPTVDFPTSHQNRIREIPFSLCASDDENGSESRCP